MPKSKDNAADGVSLSSLTKDAALRSELSSLLADYRSLSIQESTAKAAKQALTKDIAKLAKRLRITKALADDPDDAGWKSITKVERENKIISATKLLEQGVTIRVIDRATEITKTTYYRVD